MKIEGAIYVLKHKSYDVALKSLWTNLELGGLSSSSTWRCQSNRPSYKRKKLRKSYSLYPQNALETWLVSSVVELVLCLMCMLPWLLEEYSKRRFLNKTENQKKFKNSKAIKFFHVIIIVQFITGYNDVISLSKQNTFPPCVLNACSLLVPNFISVTIIISVSFSKVKKDVGRWEEVYVLFLHQIRARWWVGVCCS